jgi:hypothetical protein
MRTKFDIYVFCFFLYIKSIHNKNKSFKKSFKKVILQQQKNIHVTVDYKMSHSLIGT